MYFARTSAHACVYMSTSTKALHSYHNTTKEARLAERDIVTAILRLLRKTSNCYAWKEHGGLYGVAGTPDIIACVNGRFVAFEVKTETGKLTKLQEITMQKIRNAKGQAFKVTSMAEVAAILKQMEVVPYE